MSNTEMILSKNKTYEPFCSHNQGYNAAHRTHCKTKVVEAQAPPRGTSASGHPMRLRHAGFCS